MGEIGQMRKCREEESKVKAKILSRRPVLRRGLEEVKNASEWEENNGRKT